MRSEQNNRIQWDGITDLLLFHLGFVKIHKNIFWDKRQTRTPLLATDEHEKILTKISINTY